MYDICDWVNKVDCKNQAQDFYSYFWQPHRHITLLLETSQIQSATNKNLSAATLKYAQYFYVSFCLQNIILKLHNLHLRESSAEGDTLRQQIFIYIYQYVNQIVVYYSRHM
jgi:hypothetical protein